MLTQLRSPTYKPGDRVYIESHDDSGTVEKVLPNKRYLVRSETTCYNVPQDMLEPDTEE